MFFRVRIKENRTEKILTFQHTHAVITRDCHRGMAILQIAIYISELFGETEELSTSSDSAVVDEEMFAERPFSSMLRNLGQAIGIPDKNVYAVKKILERPEVQEKLAAVGGTFLFSHKVEEYPLVDGTIEKMYSLYLLEDEAELTGG